MERQVKPQAFCFIVLLPIRNSSSGTILNMANVIVVYVDFLLSSQPT